MGAKVLQRYQLLDQSKIDMENVAVERYLSHIGLSAGDTKELGHPCINNSQLVLCNIILISIFLLRPSIVVPVLGLLMHIAPLAQSLPPMMKFPLYIKSDYYRAALAKNVLVTAQIIIEIYPNV